MGYRERNEGLCALECYYQTIDADACITHCNNIPHVVEKDQMSDFISI